MAQFTQVGQAPAASFANAVKLNNMDETHSFRDYTRDNQRFDHVSKFYKQNHTLQTYEFNLKQRQRYAPLDKKQMTIWEAFNMLEEIVDESDPDVDDPQIVHALQTAEACRKRFPDPKLDWMPLAGLIHDLGKILAHPKFGGEPQWCVVGDTHPVGCAPSEKCVYHEFFAENSDAKHPVYSTQNGVYQAGCGLEHLTMSWGHDEYMHMVATGNNTTLPEEALYVIRFHSFYPWHQGGAYQYFMNEKDKRMLTWVKEFQKCDLYSKSDLVEDKPKLDDLKPFYDQLIHKYFPSYMLRW